MTTSVVHQPWRGPHRRSSMGSARPSDSAPVGAVPIAQLQGVVMAVYGVSASAAIRELQWHSAQRNTSLADHAEQVMGSISKRRAPITADILGALLAGPPLPRPEPGPGPGPNRRGPLRPLASPLHLVATEPPQASPGAPAPAAERWRWERDGLTRREAQVLNLIGEGLSNQDIAASLFVTVNTVKSYIRTTYRKIGVTTRTQAVRWALTHEPFSRHTAVEGTQGRVGCNRRSVPSGFSTCEQWDPHTES